MAEPLPADGKNTPSKTQFLKALRQLVDVKQKLAQIQSNASEQRGVKRGVLSAFEGIGGNKTSVKWLEMLSDIEDDDERVDAMTALRTYAGWADVQLFRAPTAEQPQGAMFEHDPEAIEAEQALKDARAYNGGWNSAKAGAARTDNTSLAGSSEHQSWDRAWLDYEADQKAFDAGGPKVASTERRPRAEKANGDGDAGAASAAAKKEAAAAKAKEAKPAKEPPAPKPKKGTPRAAADGSAIN